MIQGAGDRLPLPSQGPGISGPPSPDRSGDGDDPEATMVINPAVRHPPLNQPPDIPPGQADEEFAATLVQTPRIANRVGSDQPPMKNEPPTPPVPPQPFRGASKSEPRDGSNRAAPDPANDDDDIMEQTIIIRSDVKKE
jgi:hypothetical protein